MRARLGLGFLVAVAASLLLATSASACLTANLKLDPSAGPGDTVSYSISGIEPGATYSFTVAGMTISGQNTGNYNGVSGTFTMPDLGSHQLTVTANGETDHQDNADGSIPLSDSMQYMPPAPIVTTSQPAASPQTVEHHHSAPRSHRPPLPIAVATHVANKQRRDTASSGSAVGAAPADSVGSQPGPRHPTSGSGSAKSSKGESATIPRGVLNALTSTTKVGPADVPTVGLLLMAIIFIAGTALAAFLVYLFQTGPDPMAALKAPAPLGHDPVEVELQDMIADEMARQLLSDLELVEASVSSD